MNKVQSRWGWTLSIILAASLFGSVQAEAGLDLAYTFNAVDPANGIAEITINVKNIETSTLEMVEHMGWKVKEKVQTFSVQNAANELLNFTNASYVIPEWGNTMINSWIIQCNGATEINITYRMKVGFLDYDPTGAPVIYGYLGPDFGLMSGGMVFLVPINFYYNQPAISSMTVSFVLPANWEIHVPWALIDPLNRKYNITTNNDGFDRALGEASFAFGTAFNKYEYTVGGTILKVVLYQGYSTTVQETLAVRTKHIFEYLTEVFNGSVGDYFLLIFIPRIPDPHPMGLTINGGEYINSAAGAPYISENEEFIDTLPVYAHAIFHRWNGSPLGFSGSGAWWMDGPAEFYAQKATIWDEGYTRFEDNLLDLYNQLQENYVEMGADRALASVVRGFPDTVTADFFIYRKSKLVVFLLAKEMYLRTNGSHNLDDLMAVLYQKYKNLTGRCDEPCLQAEIEAITGSNFTQFFNDYIYGTAPLPMDWAFDDDDGDDLSNLAEIYFDTHPNLPDTDADGYTDWQEVRKR